MAACTGGPQYAASRSAAAEKWVLLLRCAHLVELADGDPLLLYDYVLLHHRDLLHLCVPGGKQGPGVKQTAATAGTRGRLARTGPPTAKKPKRRNMRTS